MNSLSFSSSPLPLLLFCLFIMLGFPVSLTNPELLENCRNAVFKCGNIYAGYPFFGGERGKACGHPRLELYCDNHTNTTTIKILGVKYQVLHINHDRRTLRLAREDLRNNAFCSPRFQNQNPILDSQLFDPVPGYTNVTLFYDCQRPSSLILGFFPCKEDSSHTYTNVSLTIEKVSPEGCSANVTVPIRQIYLERFLISALLLEEALETGFEVKWKEDTAACRNCPVSGGACGFNGVKNQSTCYCPFPFDNWEEAKECPPRGYTPGDRKNGVSLIAGIGIAGAAIAGILLGIAILGVIRRQRRKKISAVQVNARDLPTPPSSKGPTSSTTNTSQSNASFSNSRYDIERGSTYFGAHVFSYEELEEATDNFNPDAISCRFSDQKRII